MSSLGPCIMYTGCKYLRGCCSMVFRLCQHNGAQELLEGSGGQLDHRKAWGCMHWSCMNQQLYCQVLELFLLFVLGCVNWLKLVLGTGTSVNFSFPFYPIQCPRTTVSSVWIFPYWHADRGNMQLSKFLFRGIIWVMFSRLSPLSHIIGMDVVYRRYFWKSMLICCYWEVLTAPLASIPMAEQSCYPVIDGSCGYHSRNDDMLSIYLQGRWLTFQNK